MKRKIFIFVSFLILGYIAGRLWDPNYLFPPVLMFTLPISLVVAFLYPWLSRWWAFKLPFVFVLICGLALGVMLNSSKPLPGSALFNLGQWAEVFFMVFSFSFIPVLLVLIIVGLVTDWRIRKLNKAI